MTAIIVIAFLLIVALTVVLAIYITRFNRATRDIVALLESTENWRDYEIRYRELCCHYLCLIPFVECKTALHLYEMFFYKAKHKNSTHRTDGLWHILFPSIAGMGLCVLCLCSTTYAWFTATQSHTVGNITTATYDITVTAEYDGSTLNVPKNAKNCYNIVVAPNTEYVITVMATGTAKQGFCTVFDGTTLWHTDYVTAGESVTFNVRCNEAKTITLNPKWGEFGESDGATLSENTFVAPALTTPANDIENAENTQSQVNATASQKTESTASVPLTSEGSDTASTSLTTENSSTVSTDNTLPENGTTSVKTDNESSTTESAD